MLDFYIQSYLLNMGKEQAYACPICTVEYPIIENILPADLTKEHVPPHSLGGKVRCFTCATCNNTHGAAADLSLLNGIKQTAETFFSTLEEQKVRVSAGNGQILQGQMTSNTDGTMTMYHSYKNNDRKRLDTYLQSVTNGRTLDFRPILPKVDQHLFEVGLLKSAYLTAFSRFGFEILNCPAYDIVREQLQNPTTKIYYSDSIIHRTFSAEQEGLYEVEFEGQRCLCAVMKLVYKGRSHNFGILLPSLDSKESLLNFISSTQALIGFANHKSDQIIPYIDSMINSQFNNRQKYLFKKI